MLPICPNSLFILSFCTLVFVGYCEPLPEMVKGVMHRACDALPALMTSLRRGWMELPNVEDLPDVGDLCLVVIQKWM